jgi:NAD(P)-dependent dehydrogenase (short-subunit alcohol dehydrogenase family)
MPVSYPARMTDFTGRHVMVTGATGALGGGVVSTLIARGAIVHAPMVEAQVPGHVAWRGSASVSPTPGVALDDEAQVSAYVAALPPLWASIHLVGGFAMAPILDTTLAALQQQHTLNVVTSFLCCREAVRSMRKPGLGGRIVNVAARPVLAPTGGMIAYAAAKAAVASLTQSLAVELNAERILVNAIIPSLIDSPANRAAMPAADHALWPTPAQIGEAVAFLASPGNQLTSGALVPVYGRV